MLRYVALARLRRFAYSNQKKFFLVVFELERERERASARQPGENVLFFEFSEGARSMATFWAFSKYVSSPPKMRFYLPRNPCPTSPRRPSFFFCAPPKKFPLTFLLFPFCPFVKIPVFDNSSPASTFPLGRFPTQPRINDSIYTLGLPPVEERLRGFRAEPSQALNDGGSLSVETTTPR